MCGISGIALAPRRGRRVDRATLLRMRDALVHRGPDDAGLFLAGNVGLGHRRLSIVDTAHGHQPMASDDRSQWIVYNGEVYNHPELRARLEAEGHRFRTRCDTETVLRLFEQRGVESLPLLRGMFALAVWSARRDELLLARDPLGIKPLYYVHQPDGSLYFASEIKALLAGGAVAPALNHDALPDYLANHAPSGPETLFAGVRRLPPGHYLRWRGGETEICAYGEAGLARPVDERRSEEDLVAEFAELFQEAVRSHLMADVPLGVFLSGGIDSAAITATTARLVDRPVRTFSVAFAERDANELRYARMVASAFRTDHHEVVVSPEEFFRALPELLWHEDEPIAHPSSIPLYFVAKRAAEQVKVVLTGEGSDELLAGYARYWKTLRNLQLAGTYARVAPAPVRRGVRRAVLALPRGWSVRGKLTRSFLVRPDGLDSLYLDNFAVFDRAEQARLLSPEARERTRGVGPYEHHLAHLRRSRAGSQLGRLLDLDLRTYLHELLMKQDQMSMAASLESRVPFLDQRLVAFSASLPDELKLRGLSTKHILRRIMAGVLPAPILGRRKMGFPVPFGAWVRGSFRHVVDDLVLGERARERKLFDPAYVRQIAGEHLSGRVDHGQRLWALVNLELWQRRFVDGEPLPAAERRQPAAAVAG